jgi:hypothetical protein
MIEECIRKCFILKSAEKMFYAGQSSRPGGRREAKSQFSKTNILSKLISGSKKIR